MLLSTYSLYKGQHDVFFFQWFISVTLVEGLCAVYET
jgi:hypothetical protein